MPRRAQCVGRRIDEVGVARRASACARRRGRSPRPAPARSPSPRWRRRPPSPGARARPGGRRAGARSRPRGARPRAGPPLGLELLAEVCAPRRSRPSSTARHHKLPAPMAVSIAVLPGDGIGPEIIAPTLEVLLAALGDFDVRGAPVRRRVDRRPRHRADRRDARRLPRGRRRAAGRRRRPEVGHDRPGRAAPRAGPARPAQGARACTPTCARSGRSPALLRRQPAAARA